MAQRLKSVRGMNDLLPPESDKWDAFESRCRELFVRYGYREIRTPILEPTELFQRGIGEATDIVEKEMYTFADKSERSLTMRPEGTAACVRAYIQHNVGRQEPVTRWFYSGPMFRYERMQTGRYRQFYQIGVEAYGVAEATLEAEQITMLYELYRSLQVGEIRVLINSVGQGEDRPRYREALTSFAEPLRHSLCGACQERLTKNPLRILDCKVELCRELLADAPSVLDSLGEQSLEHFSVCKDALDAAEVPYTVDPRLVRGLDYYTGTVFEIVSEGGQLGTQSTLVAGGRYDGLVESLGGPQTPAVGFALGVERAILSLPGANEGYSPRTDIFVCSRGQAAGKAKHALAAKLRRAGLAVELEHREVGLKAQFKRADKLRARFVATLGESELANATVRLKDMDARSEEELPQNQLADFVATKLRDHRG